MGSYVTIIEGKMDIVEEEFLKWFGDKDQEWWNEKYGLCPTGQNEDQDDESNIRSHIHSKITEINDTGTLCSDGCVGTLMALTGMIAEYLIEKGCVEVSTRELYSSDHYYVIR